MSATHKRKRGFIQWMESVDTVHVVNILTTSVERVRSSAASANVFGTCT
jgi:hypothetical protein